MKIHVTVKANSKENLVEKIDEGNYQVRVKAPATDGKANQAVIKLLSDYFDIPKSKIELLRGLKSKLKSFEIRL